MKFVIFYTGPATPPDASHKGWMTWFASLGNALVDKGSPLSKGRSIRSNGSVTDSQTMYNGYSIIEAKDETKALKLIESHPYLQLGDDYTIEVFKRG